MKDLGEASFVLGIQILRDRSQGILRLSQENYINKVLQRFDMKDSKLGDTPIAKGDKFSLKQCPNNDLERNEIQKIPYASAMGSLMYAQVCTRPDIAFMVWRSSCTLTPILLDVKIANAPCLDTSSLWLASRHPTRVQNKQIFIKHIGTSFMLADPLTKGLIPKANTSGKVMIPNTLNQRIFFILPIRKEKRRSPKGIKAVWLRKTTNQRFDDLT
ncbi:hypothetical protein CR513_59232, partial [Mucuna pruriens]